MLGGRKLYSINNGPYFITPEHSLLTTTGWKAADPDTFRAESPKLAEQVHISKLQVGDELIMRDGTTNRVTSFVGKSAPNQRLYNFKLSGKNTYFVDGYTTLDTFGNKVNYHSGQPSLRAEGEAI